mmetsp:Transcript_8625/g.11922  ORF Transcript_8625/g.11922 Transcript_8625/m.11922 type:complete len:166 (+) Transcript_8625:33-530(+)
MSKIFDYLYLGSAVDARNQAFIEENNIHHVIICARECKEKFPKVQYLKFPLNDFETEKIHVYFEDAHELIEKVRKNYETTRKACLVHCLVGASRSATIVISYCMKYHNMKLNEAYQYVHSKRDIIGPNRGFCAQLWEYEAKLFGENELTMTRFDDKHPEWYWNKI